MIIKDFSIRQGEICFLASFADILRYYGFDIGEAFVLGMGPGLQFQIGYRNAEKWFKEGTESEFSIDCVHISLDKAAFHGFFNRFGMSMETVKSYSLEDIMNNIKNCIFSERPILIGVDIFYLDYHIEYQRTHDAHVITIYGIDEKSGKAWIADNYITTLKKSHYIGEISLDSLVKALDLTLTDSDYPYLSWDIYRDCDVKGISSKDIAEGIRLSGKQMLQPENNISCQCGIKGINAFVVMLEDLMNQPFCQAVSERLEAFHLMLTGLGGPVSTRKLYAEFLSRSILDAEILLDENIYKEYSNLAGEWRIASTLLLKAAKTGSAAHIGRARERIITIADKEAELAECLCKAEYRTFEMLKFNKNLY